jgi:uncharacterized membrane protein
VNLLFPLSVVICFWSLLAALFVGVGLLMRGHFRSRACSGHAVFTSFWVGWGLVLAYLQIWNFFAPINSWVLPIPVLVGMTGLTCYHRHLLRILVPRDHFGRVLLALSILLAFWLANQSIAPQDNDNDAGIYRINAIMWSQNFRVIPGLANLNIHLGYNNSYFLYLAMVDPSQLYMIGYGTLLFATLVRMVSSVLKVAIEGWKARPQELLFALMLVPTLAHERAWRESATSTDAPVFLLEVVITAEVLGVLTDFAAERRVQTQAIAAIGLLSAAGAATKTSMLVFAAATLAVVAVAVVRGATPRGRMVALAAGSATLSLILVPWVVRGVILSGYLAFPLASSALPVDWRVPQSEVDREAEYVVGFARTRDAASYRTALVGWNWMAHWFEIESSTFAIPLAIAAVGLVSSARQVRSRPVLVSLLPAAVAAGAWFLTAPDGRFAGSAFWLLGAGATAAAALAFPGRAGSYALLLVGAVTAAQYAIPLAGLHPVPPGPDDGFYPLPRPALGQFTTAAGLVVGMPLSGGQIWGNSLLSTPTPDGQLRLRQVDDISGGFTKRA